MLYTAKDREPSDNSREPEPAAKKPTWGYDPEAYRLGAAVRRHYCEQFSRLESLRTGKPQTYHPGPRWDGDVRWEHPRLEKLPEPQSKRAPPVWLRLGEICYTEGLDPQRLIRCYFDLKSMFQTPWRPDEILRDELMLQRYKRIPKRLRSKLAITLHTDRSAYFNARAGWQMMEPTIAAGRLRRRVLLDAGNGLSALFRYCWAARFRSREWDLQVCKLYFAAACYQYLQLPELYDEVWKDLIPRWFPALAQRWLEEQHAQAQD